MALAPLLLVCCALAQEAKPLPALPAAEAKKLRQAFDEALASSEPKDWSKCVAQVGALEAKYERGSLLAVVRQGPDVERGLPKARKVGKKKEELGAVGQVTYGYAFEHDGRTYGYCVDVPHAYDGTRPFALLIDPGHGSGADKDQRGKADFLPFYRGQVDSAGLEDWLIARTEIVEQVGADGRAGAKPEDEVAAIFAAFLRDFTTRFAVDPGRVYVAGLSQTGFWAWYLGRELADRLAGIAPMSAVTWGVDQALENLHDLPVFVLHGDADAICPVAQPRATTKHMEALGLCVKYVEVPGAGHDVGVWSRLDEGLKWLVAQPRERAPKRVVKVAGTSANPWADWVRLDELAKEGSGAANAKPGARVEARIDGQRIEVTSTGVDKLSLWLSGELVDLDAALEVRWNGKPAFAGVPARSAATAVRAVLERCDWRFLPEARIELK